MDLTLVWALIATVWALIAAVIWLKMKLNEAQAHLESWEAWRLETIARGERQAGRYAGMKRSTDKDAA